MKTLKKAAYFRDQIAKYKEMQKTKVTDQDTPIISEKDDWTHNWAEDQYPSWWSQRKRTNLNSST